MRVSGQSKASAIAGAMAGSIREGDFVTLEVIGVQATYTAIKAILIAQKFLAADNLHPVMELSTERRRLKGGEVTVILVNVKGQKNG